MGNANEENELQPKDKQNYKIVQLQKTSMLTAKMLLMLM